MEENIPRIFCGSDQMCTEDLGDALRSTIELRRAIDSIDISIEIEPNKDEDPLINRIKNIREIASKISEILSRYGLQIDAERIVSYIKGEHPQDETGSLALYVFRRIAYKALGGKSRAEKASKSGRCPICGLVPIAGISRKIAELLYTRKTVELCCICGHSWEYGYFRCPSCGNSLRDRFEVLIAHNITIQRCLECGHIIGIIEESPYIDKDIAPIIVSHILARVALIQKSGET